MIILKAEVMQIMTRNSTMMRMKTLVQVLPSSSRENSHAVLNPSKTIETARQEGKGKALKVDSR